MINSQIEYFAVSIKKTLTQDKLEFTKKMKEISERDITYMDILSIKTIIQFKWDAYTK